MKVIQHEMRGRRKSVNIEKDIEYILNVSTHFNNENSKDRLLDTANKVGHHYHPYHFQNCGKYYKGIVDSITKCGIKWVELIFSTCYSYQHSLKGTFMKYGSNLEDV